MSHSDSFTEHSSAPLLPPTSRGKHSDASGSEASKPLAFKQLPAEILLDILEFALPPTVFLDASLTCGPLSAWCLAQRTKKSLVLVCKFWREIGTPLLYREIHLRRIGQVAALLSTLRGNTRLGEMILDINVSCHIMPQYLVMFDEAFQHILGMSPNATRLSLRMGVRDLLVSSMRQYDLSNVVHLDVQVGNERLSDILLCLPQCKHLTILSLSFDTYDKGYDKHLTLNRLQEFQITVMWSSRRELDFLDAIARKWKLPCLCRFTIYEWRPKPSQVSKYLNFLDAHGKCLTTLSITAPLDRTQCADEPLLHLQHVQAVLDRCPALEHLALFPPMTEVAGSHEPLLGMRNIQKLLDNCSSPMHGRPLSHKTLRWIDIWATWHPFAPNPSSIPVSWKSQYFPQFHAIRLLDWALLVTTGPRLHLAIPPGSMQHHETLEWCFPGVRVQHDAGHIYKRDMDYDYVSSYMAACDGHESPRSIDNAGVDSMSGDSDCDSDSDETFESVSWVSYSALDSEEGDLETLEYPFVCNDDLESSLEDETNVDFEMTLDIYHNILGTS
ncbi:hypothetical protein CY34DRAFT_800409 [Suillus luteus UH-Slu-Lm8-n1]|uniref:F-box domain-containing protein n=1 Tax=Suillus luteus UH-Slu-Lm8-n1 TaxID=930992 RepID=A0A0D0BKC3_9AGAM|nr:hypothetical protein CY34DRAFT_800409 [Suillus luteus UH-Slu-Lm8-n1]